MSAHSRTPLDDGRAAQPAAIALFGLFGSGNTGNDGSLEAMLALVRRVRPEAQLLCICGDPANVRRDFHLAALPIEMDRPDNPVLRKLANLLRAFRQLRGCELLIVPGTGILDDFGTGPTGQPLALFTWCLAARLRRAEIAFVSIGAGPIRHRFSRWLMKVAVGMAGYRSYRDQISKDFVEGLGIRVDEDPVYPDLAFSLTAPATGRSGAAGPAAVGLGVMTYQGWRNDPAEGAAIYAAYLSKLAEFTLWLLDRGHRVRLLMGDATDRRAAEDLRREVLSRRPSVPAGQLEAAPCRTLHELMREITEVDVVVATRFHNIVCALKLCRPTISIGYADKNDALMADMALERFCQPIEGLDVDLLIRQFTELVGQTSAWQQRLGKANHRYRAELRHQESLLAAHLLPQQTSPSGPLAALPLSARHKDGG